MSLSHAVRAFLIALVVALVALPASGASADAISDLLDITPPSTTDDVAAGYQRGPVTVTLTATDEDGGSGVASTTYTLLADGQAVGGPQTYDPARKPALENGQALRYASTDRAGNIEQEHDSPAAKVDATVPQTTITQRPPSVTRDTRPVVAFTSQAETDRFECSLDGSAFAACSSPFTPDRPLAGGDHTFVVRAVNRAGVADPMPASTSFVVDTAPAQTATEAASPSSPVPPAPEAATSARAVLGPRSLTIATGGRIGVGCATDRGPLRSCVARIVDARGTVLAEGAAAFVGAQATSMRVVLLRTGAGRVALRRRPSGVPAFLDLVVTTPDGRTLVARSPTTLLASDRIVVLVDRSARLGADARRQIAALAEVYANARAVTCTAYTDRRHGVSAARAAALTRAQARAACALVARMAPKAKTTLRGQGRRSPVAANRTAAGRARNRRVVLTFG
jgi:hypothetical protein